MSNALCCFQFIYLIVGFSAILPFSRLSYECLSFSDQHKPYTHTRTHTSAYIFIRREWKFARYLVFVCAGVYTRKLNKVHPLHHFVVVIARERRDEKTECLSSWKLIKYIEWWCVYYLRYFADDLLKWLAELKRMAEHYYYLTHFVVCIKCYIL